MTQSADDERILSPEAGAEEGVQDRALRPKRFGDFVGQAKIKDVLDFMVTAAKKRGDAVEHVLFCGPPGLGKTTLSFILAAERGTNLHVASAPAIEHKGQLASLLTKLDDNDVLFIDEIHRLSSVVEENLYTAMEDRRIEIVNGEGPYAQSVSLSLPPFTLVGATTRTGLLTNPLRARFGYTARLDYYAPEELEKVVLRSAGLLGLPISGEAAVTLSKRSRGTPRISNRLLRLGRDFAEARADGALDDAVANDLLERLGVDSAGLDDSDLRYLNILIDHYDGGPVGVETLGAAMSEPRDTLEDVIEPYLLQQGFLARTPRGRVATRRAFEHLGKPMKKDKGQGRLF